MIRKKITLVFSIISAILIIIAYFFPFLSTFYAGENHIYFLDGRVHIVEAGTITYYFLIPAEYTSSMFILNSTIFWIAGITLLINAALIFALKNKLTNIFSIFSGIMGALVIIIILIVYFTFSFVGAGITQIPELGFTLSLIGGLSAIGGGTIDIIKEKKSSITS
ncbi:MAG: hypothetical protein ACW96X_12045 [Promethearchaeota archaeon]|jgi:hypothetical protein